MSFFFEEMKGKRAEIAGKADTCSEFMKGTVLRWEKDRVEPAVKPVVSMFASLHFLFCK